MNSASTSEHREKAGQQANVSVLTVSDTRTIETDTGGKLIVDLCEAAGYRVVERRIVVDEIQPIRVSVLSLLSHLECDAVLITGGTGLADRDRTVDLLLEAGAVLPDLQSLFIDPLRFHEVIY